MIGKLLLCLIASAALLSAACAGGAAEGDSGVEARESGVDGSHPDALLAHEGSADAPVDAKLAPDAEHADAGHPDGSHPPDGGTDARDGATEGGCGDTKHDPANCGMCGHACDPAEGCEGGLCDPVFLNGELGRATSIALDTTSLYFASMADAATGSLLESTPLGGGITTTIATSSDATLAGTIIVDGTSVYGYSKDIASNGTIWTTATTAPTAATVLVSGFTADAYPVSLATDGTDVYYNVSADLVTHTPAGIARVPVTGGTAQLWNDADDYYEVVILGATAYFSSGYLGGVSSELLSAAPKADTETSISTSAGSIFVVGSSAVYKAVERAGGYAVQSVALGGGSPVVISPTYMFIYALAFDGTAVYCAAYVGSNYVVDRVPSSGGPILRLYSGSNHLDQLLVDTDHVFVLASGTILRVPK